MSELLRSTRLRLLLAGTLLMLTSQRGLVAATITDDRAAGVTYSSGWTVIEDPKCYGGAGHACAQPEETAEITFSGPAIVIYALRSAETGLFRVAIDGTHDATIDTRNQHAVVDYQCPVYQVNGLADGPHTLKIATGNTGRVVLDAFKHGDGVPFVPRKVMMPTLPVGSIRMGGWIKSQMQEDMERGWATSSAWKDGYPDKPYYHPFVLRQGSRWGGEYPSHWISAVARFGWLADAPQYREQATAAVRAILDSVETDGYLGCLPPEIRWSNSKGGFFTMWSYGEGLNAFLEYYQYTRDDKVLAAVKKAYDLMEAHANQAFSGRCYEISCANAATALYQALGDRHYLDRAQYWIKRYLGGYTSAPNAGEITLDPHSAGSGIIQSALIDYFAATFDVAAYYNILRSNDYLLNGRQQVHGGAAIDGVYELGASWAENFVPANPYAASEACSLYYWTYLWMRLLSVSGESRWADYAERVLLNAVPAQRSKDGRCTAYGARPNETATHENSEWGEDAEQYKQDIHTACCQSCLPRTYPLLNQYAVLQTQDEGLAVAFYGAGEATVRLNSSSVTLKQQTNYPFEEHIELTVAAEPSRRFPLHLRIPVWCEHPTVQVNGVPVLNPRPGSWAVLDRTWTAADVVSIRFPMQVKLHYWQAKAVAVERGPLVYTLSLPYRAIPTDAHGGFKPVLDDGRSGEANPLSVWAYCPILDRDDPASSFSFVTNPFPNDRTVWKHSPVALRVHARKLRNWKNGDEALPNRPFELEGQEQMIELVPIGGSTLRMTYLPYELRGERPAAGQ